MIPEVDYRDYDPFVDDKLSHQITWKDASIESLRGKAIRLEIYVRGADIYTFLAGGQGAGPAD